MIEIRTPSPDDLDAMFRRDEEAFGDTFTPEQREVSRPLIDLERFRIACDGSDLVGLAGTFAFELTLPGGAAVPMAGTTWVSVAATHRRQGLLRQLMDAIHDDVDARGEPVAGLHASEAAIYERFGYGPATRWRHVEIDRRRARLAERFRPAPGGIRLIDPLAEVDRLTAIYDRARRLRVGEVTRSAEWTEMRLRSDTPRCRGAIHDDGFAIWSITPDWNDFDAQHELRLHDLVACTPEAHAALWDLVLSHDLVGPIRSRPCVAVDDALPGLLDDSRMVKTTALNDALWLCPRRVGDVLAARAYRVDDSLVVAVEGERWRVDGGPDSAECSTTDADADCTVSRGALGSLLLGGVTAHELAASGRLVGSDLGRIDAFFGWAPGPHCTTMF